MRLRDVTVDGLPAEDELAVFEHASVWVTGYPLTDAWLPADPLDVRWEAAVGLGRAGTFTGVRYWLPAAEMPDPTAGPVTAPPTAAPSHEGTPKCEGGCRHEWTADGYLHACTGIRGHQGMRHRCYCDAYDGTAS